jgi:replicative DNA helicase
MHDISLLKKLGNRTLFTRLSPYIKEHAVSKETWKVMGVMSNYFRSYPDVEEVVWKDFYTFFLTLSKLKGEEHATYTIYFKKIEEEDVTSVLVDDVLKNYITKDYATQILNKAMGVIQDKTGDNIEDVSNILASYNKEVGRAVSTDDLFVPSGLSFTLKAVSSKGYEWRLEEMNKAAGPLRDGDFVILAARPNTGKTTFVAAELSYFAAQMPDPSRPIIWVNNEEGGSKVMHRIIQSYFGVTVSALTANEVEYNERWEKEVGNRIRIVNEDMVGMDVKSLTDMFNETNPSLIVFDQLDKVWGYGKMEREDLRLGKLYEWARNLAKKFGPVIAVSQASEAAAHSHYIDMSMLRGSKTDKAGEADLIITIGRKEEDDYTRYLHIPKNKLWGGPRSEEHYRHGKFECTIRPEIARYEGVF